jgi:hypothetical protein
LIMKKSKIFKSKQSTISILVILYSFLMLLLPRVTGYLTVLGTLAGVVYLFIKSQKFKEKRIMSKVLTCIGLCFILIWGLLLTTLSPESLQRARLSSEKTKIEREANLPTEKSAK